MSEQQVEFMGQVCDALTRGDQQRLEALLRDALHADFEFHSLVPGRVRRGFPGMQEFFADMEDVWEDYAQETEEMIDLGDHVLVVLRISAKGVGSGVRITQRSFWVWTFRGEKAIRARSFASRSEALEAVGLSE